VLEGVGVALGVIFEPYALLLLFFGAVFGLFCGVIPGLSGSTALILLIPLTFNMDFGHAMVLLMAAATAGTVGGSITSILLGVPGAGVNAATVFDGFPLARLGRGGEAVAAAAMSSALGGVFGVFVLILLIPFLRQVVLAFGPPEFLMLAVWGLSVIAAVSGRSLISGLIGAVLGLMMSFVGFNSVIGGLRFTFGWIYLWDGLRLAPVFIGLFAIATALDLAVSGEKIVKEGIELKTGFRQLRKGLMAPFNHFALFIKSSLMGTIIGIIPGVGGVVAAFLAYGQAVQSSKDKTQFGRGDIRGVVAPESSNNAKDGGSLVPTLAFGIPGSESMAILLGAFLIHGVTPGPGMLEDRINETWIIILTLAVASVISSPIAVLVSTQLVKANKLSPFYLSPIIVTAGLVGAYAFNSEINDVFLAFAIGVFGYLAIKFDLPRAPIIIAYILGGLTERSFFQTIQMGRGSFAIFFTRPIALALLALVVVTACAPYFMGLKARMRTAERLREGPR